MNRQLAYCDRVHPLYNSHFTIHIFKFKDRTSNRLSYFSRETLFRRLQHDTQTKRHSTQIKTYSYESSFIMLQFHEEQEQLGKRFDKNVASKRETYLRSRDIHDSLPWNENTFYLHY